MSSTTRQCDRNPPTRAEWGEINPNDLDASWAFKQFFGKSFEQAVSLFQANALFYQEDLMSMPKPVFNFYAPAFAHYVTSSESAADADAGSSFLRLLIWISSNNPQIFEPECKKLLLEAAEFVAKNQAFYDADVAIYGTFSELLKELVGAGVAKP